MREAARALDDVSDHLGEVLRRADQLLTEWSGFGAQVRAQVEREVATIGTVVDGAVARAASAGIDRAVADRLRALTGELDRLEQRTRAAARAVVEHREADRRVLWIVVAGIVLANALLVALLLRKPVAAPVAEPIRVEAPAAPVPLALGSATGGSGEATVGSGSDAVAAPVPASGSNAPDAGSNAGAAQGSAVPSQGGATAGSDAPATGAAKPVASHAAKPTAGGLKPSAAPVALPPKPRYQQPHKKQP